MSNLTKKVWNTLSKTTRVDIIEIVKGDIDRLPQFYRDLTEYPYQHDFNFDHKGEKLKEILSHCRMEADGTIDIVITIKPTYAPVESKNKKVSSPQSSVSTQKRELQTYYLDYYPTWDHGNHDDLQHAWCEAYSEEEARQRFEEEVDDLDEIIQIHR